MPHVVFFCGRELAEPRGDALKPGLFVGNELSLGQHPGAQHFGDLARVTGPQELGDLVEGEAAVFERQDARQITELRQVVEAVAGLRMDVRRAQEPQRIVVSKGLDRDLADPGEVANLDQWAALLSLSFEPNGVYAPPVGGESRRVLYRHHCNGRVVAKDMSSDTDVLIADVLNHPLQKR